MMPDEDHDEAIPLFRFVMGQIITSREPLPKVALTLMRQRFPQVDINYNVDDAIGQIGSLMTGTVNS